MTSTYDARPVARVHFDAGHDCNGNPRRAWLVTWADGTAQAVEEDYAGVPDWLRGIPEPGPRVPCSPQTWRSLLANYAARQLALDATPPYQSHSATSIEAAASVAPSTGALRERVHAWLATYGPATDEQIIDGLGANANTVRPRRVELCRDRRVRAVGRGRTRSGRAATLWAAL